MDYLAIGPIPLALAMGKERLRLRLRRLGKVVICNSIGHASTGTGAGRRVRLISACSLGFCNICRAALALGLLFGIGIDDVAR